MVSFSKECKICGKPFESDSRNKKYCSDKCAKHGTKKARRSRKLKRINAIKSGDDKEIEALIAEAYRLSRAVAKLCLIKKCSCEDKDHICKVPLHVHHKNHNPFDARPENLCWLCEKAHHELHAAEEDCSIIDETKAYIVIRKQAEIRERNINRKIKENHRNE